MLSWFQKRPQVANVLVLAIYGTHSARRIIDGQNFTISDVILIRTELDLVYFF